MGEEFHKSTLGKTHHLKNEAFLFRTRDQGFHPPTCNAGGRAARLSTPIISLQPVSARILGAADSLFG